MYLVRPVTHADLDAFETLASRASASVHTLPRRKDAIAQAISETVQAFSTDIDAPGDETYRFVLDQGDGRLAGTSAIAATAGARGTFFAFRRDVMHQVSRDLNVSHSVEALSLNSDLTNCSQLSAFSLDLAYPARAEASLLSRARLLYAASHPHRFADRFFASMPGLADAQGRAPFWEALGRKFFQMDFLQAERMIGGARNRTVIVELMPHYPVYVPLLPVDARMALGQVHPDASLAYSLLCEEGFEPGQYVDIFDGGAVLQSHRSTLRAFADAVRCRVSASTEEGPDQVAHLVTNGRENAFRAVLTALPMRTSTGDAAALNDVARRALDVTAGDTVICLRC